MEPLYREPNGTAVHYVFVRLFPTVVRSCVIVSPRLVCSSCMPTNLSSGGSELLHGKPGDCCAEKCVIDSVAEGAQEISPIVVVQLVPNATTPPIIRPTTRRMSVVQREKPELSPYPTKRRANPPSHSLPHSPSPSLRFWWKLRHVQHLIISITMVRIASASTALLLTASTPIFSEATLEYKV